jgi:uncharacterized protein (UPF0332 family)
VTDESTGRSAVEELGLAREELQIAEALLAMKHPRVAITRAYYAVFHAMRAVLFSIGIEPSTHRGTLQMFSLHLVKPGTFEPAISRLGSRLQKYREEADYGTGFVFDEAGTTDDLAQVRAFVERVEAVLANPSPT